MHNQLSPLNSVNCMYQPSEYLTHNFKNNIILPGERVNVQFEFIPRAARHYKDEVVFQINGITNSVVTFSGHGIQLQASVMQCNVYRCSGYAFNIFNVYTIF